MNPDASVLLLGDPISRSLSPVMQNAAFEALRIDCRYVLREVNRSDLDAAMAEIRGAAGRSHWRREHHQSNRLDTEGLEHRRRGIPARARGRVSLPPLGGGSG